MPQIIPIRDLKNTSEISQKCRESREPIFITKNGYGDMVIMSMQLYEEIIARQDAYEKLAVAKKQIEEGKTRDGMLVLDDIRKKYGL